MIYSLERFGKNHEKTMVNLLTPKNLLCDTDMVVRCDVGYCDGLSDYISSYNNVGCFMGYIWRTKEDFEKNENSIFFCFPCELLRRKGADSVRYLIDQYLFDEKQFRTLERIVDFILDCEFTTNHEEEIEWCRGEKLSTCIMCGEELNFYMKLSQ
jgi:hypothetical protein